MNKIDYGSPPSVPNLVLRSSAVLKWGSLLWSILIAAVWVWSSFLPFYVVARSYTGMTAVKVLFADGCIQATFQTGLSQWKIRELPIIPKEIGAIVMNGHLAVSYSSGQNIERGNWLGFSHQSMPNFSPLSWQRFTLPLFSLFWICVVLYLCSIVRYVSTLRNIAARFLVRIHPRRLGMNR